MKFLEPLQLKESYYSHIEKKLDRFFYNLLIKPIEDKIKETFNKNILKNSASTLPNAINSGRIYWQDGYMLGNFNSSISKELKKLGARYSRAKKGWIIAKRDLDPNSLIAVAQADMRFDSMTKDIITYLDGINVDEELKQLDLFEAYETSIDKMERDYKKIASKITIPPKLTEEQKRIITEQWTNNLKLYIQDFTQEEILKLRSKVEKNVFAGKRASNLVKEIQKEYNTTNAKARFLARQETSLLTSKFRESRFKDIGVSRYKWRGAMDARERPDHKKLEGKIFSFDNPPVVDTKTGRRANAGEDFGCRCVAIPIVD